MLKKLLLSFFSGLIILFSFAPYLEVSAQVINGVPVGETNAPANTTTNSNTTNAPAAVQSGTWYNPTFSQWYSKVYDPNVSPSNEIFGERYTAAQVEWVVYGVWAFILNIFIPQDVTSCLFTNSANIETCTDILKQAMGTTAAVDIYAKPQNQKNLWSLVFAADRQFSGISYTRGKIQNFSLVPVAHAQGFGYTTGLAGIQNMWSAFRNIAFGLFVIVAIVFAFMIMFRVKISPQVVITVQSAIPKLILTLILVTFSYAIAGFLVDLTYVVIGLLSVVLTPLIPNNLLQNANYTAPDVFKLLTTGYTQGKIFGIQSSSAFGGIFNLLGVYLTPLATLSVIVLVGSIFVSFISLGAAAWVLLLAIIILAVAFIMLIWMSIKIIYALFKAFAYILLLTIFAPIQLTIGALVPGLGFGQWLKSYVSYLSVFVVTGVLWLFAWIFSLLAWNAFWGSGTPTPINTSWPPLLGSSGFGLSLVYTGASFVMFTLIPKATEVVQGFISGKPFAYGAAVGEAVVSPFTGFIKTLVTTSQVAKAAKEGGQILRGRPDEV